MRERCASRAGVLITTGLLCLGVVKSARADVTLTLSAPSYPIGERVSFVLLNDTEWMIQLPTAPGWWIRDTRGIYVAPCKVGPIEIDVHPGWSFDWQWNQQDCYENQLPPGRYRLVVNYRCSDCPVLDNTIEVWFEIGMVPVEPTSWGGIKALYR